MSAPASSGKTVRFHLDRGGSRKANGALYRIVIVRMSYDEATRIYVAQRLAERKTLPEIIRCLKRFVAREALGAIINPPDEIPTGADLREARTAAGITLTQLALLRAGNRLLVTPAAPMAIAWCACRHPQRGD